MFFLHVCATHSSITNQEEGMGVRVWVRIGIKSEAYLENQCEAVLKPWGLKDLAGLGKELEVGALRHEPTKFWFCPKQEKEASP